MKSRPAKAPFESRDLLDDEHLDPVSREPGLAQQGDAPIGVGPVDGCHNRAGRCSQPSKSGVGSREIESVGIHLILPGERVGQGSATPGQERGRKGAETGGQFVASGRDPGPIAGRPRHRIWRDRCSRS